MTDTLPRESSTPSLPHWLRVLIIGRNPRRTLWRIVALVVATVITVKYIVTPVRVTGISMEPTYLNGSVNFIYRLAYLRHPPRRGDVVAIRFSGPHVMLLKRVVGLPGETVSFADGRVCINGTPLPEPYLRYHLDWEFSAGTLGTNEYYVVGDNRSMPPHYHDQGRAQLDHIVGRALLRGNLP